MNDLKEIGGFIVSADPFVQHDTSLSGNGTVNSPLGVVPGYNETVLWSGTMNTIPSSATLSESYKNFETIKIYAKTEDQYNCTVAEYPNESEYFNILIHQGWPNNSTAYWDKGVTIVPNDDHTKISAVLATLGKFTSGGVSCSFRTTATTGTAWVQPYKIIGINRKQ